MAVQVPPPQVAVQVPPPQVAVQVLPPLVVVQAPHLPVAAIWALVPVEVAVQAPCQAAGACSARRPLCLQLSTGSRPGRSLPFWTRDTAVGAAVHALGLQLQEGITWLRGSSFFFKVSVGAGSWCGQLVWAAGVGISDVPLTLKNMYASRGQGNQHHNSQFCCYLPPHVQSPAAHSLWDPFKLYPLSLLFPRRVLLGPRCHDCHREHLLDPQRRQRKHAGSQPATAACVHQRSQQPLLRPQLCGWCC